MFSNVSSNAKLVKFQEKATAGGDSQNTSTERDSDPSCFRFAAQRFRGDMVRAPRMGQGPHTTCVIDEDAVNNPGLTVTSLLQGTTVPNYAGPDLTSTGGEHGK
jgi:hypothetical protein